MTSKVVQHADPDGNAVAFPQVLDDGQGGTGVLRTSVKATSEGASSW